MQVSDNIFLGNAPTGLTSQGSAGNPGGTGVGPMARQYGFDIVPLALQTNNIAAAQAVAGAKNLTLTAGTGVTTVTRPDGTIALVLDVPRCLQYVSSNAGDTTQTITTTGWDQYGQPMTETVTLTGTAPVVGKKAFLQVANEAISAATAGNISSGTSDTFGLPFAVVDRTLMLAVKWNNALADDAGTLTVADGTSPATAATGDVRGTYKPSAGASDGVKRLVALIHLRAIASGPDATRLGALGVTQF